MAVEDFEDLGEAAGCVIDLDGDDIGDLDGELMGLQDVAGLLPVADEETEHAEELRVAEGERGDVDAVRGQDLQRLVDGAGLVFDEK